MTLYRHPHNGEERDLTGPAAQLALNKGWAEVIPAEVLEAEAEAVAEDLKGAELDDALRAASLPLTGKVAEKRARLAEYIASLPPLAEGGVLTGPGPVVIAEEGTPGNPMDPSQDPQSNNDAPEEHS